MIFEISRGSNKIFPSFLSDRDFSKSRVSDDRDFLGYPLVPAAKYIIMGLGAVLSCETGRGRTFGWDIKRGGFEKPGFPFCTCSLFDQLSISEHI